MALTEAEYERLAEKMLSTYEHAETDMMTKVANRLMKGVETPGWTERKYAEVSNVRREIAASLSRLKAQRNLIANDSIYAAFASGQQEHVTEMECFTSSLGIGTSLSPNAQKVARILNELTSSMDASDRRILRKAEDAYAQIIGESSARAATGTITLRRAVQESLNDFADRGIASFVDKAGKQWDMATYAEMALLTAVENATVEGYADSMQSYGFDLAVISTHAGACPLCEAWQGVVVSVSGNNPDHPSLEEAKGAGVFHPRCLHHLSTYYDGITKGARLAPRQMKAPSAEYTVRSKQRYCERMIRRWKRRMAVAADEDEERYAYRHVRSWQASVRELIQTAPSHLPRKYWREGGRQLLRFTPKRRKPKGAMSNGKGH